MISLFVCFCNFIKILLNWLVIFLCSFFSFFFVLLIFLFFTVDISISSEDQEDTSWIDCSDELAINCFSQFKEIRKSGHLTDVIIKVEGREIPAHRVILTATIPFFGAMFTSDMIEANSNVITLPSLLIFNYLFSSFTFMLSNFSEEI